MVKTSRLACELYGIKKLDDITPFHYIYEDDCYMCGERRWVCSGTACCRTCDKTTIEENEREIQEYLNSENKWDDYDEYHRKPRIRNN